MKNGKFKTNGAGANETAHTAGQVVLVFQGGGALGAFQAGVYHALHESGIAPDWIIGTSIGAINAALIAGNEGEARIAALQKFWQRVAHRSFWDISDIWPRTAQSLLYWNTIGAGVPGFFEPNFPAFLGPRVALGADHAGYYSTAPLEKTLNDLVDFSRINMGAPRLTVGAAHVRTSRMRYFDSRDTAISATHIMASGALPPAFPAVRIGGELYWDGGILSNTPTEAIFDENPRRSSLIFAVHMWNPDGPEPETIWDVLNRHKDIQYSSRVATHIARQMEAHRLRHVIRDLLKHVPDEERRREEVRALAAYGCTTTMHVVRLLAPGLDHEDHTKDVDFSWSGIRKRWEAGYEKTLRAIRQAPWTGEFDPLDAVILHEARDAMPAELVAAPAGLPSSPATRANAFGPESQARAVG